MPNEESKSTDIPCGQCPAGNYDYGVVVAGVSLFGNHKDRAAALSAIPPCKTFPERGCVGCRDFLTAVETFPFDLEALGV